MSSTKVILTPEPDPLIGSLLGPRHWGQLWSHWRLIRSLTKRRLQERFRGSVLGTVWVFLLPLLMLSVYAFAFVVVLGGGLGTPEQSQAAIERTFQIFCGLIVFWLFAEATSKASTCIVAQPQFVKKVVFPLATLPVIAVFESFVLSLASVAVLLVGAAFVLDVHATWLLLPLPLIPLLLFSMGLAWALAAIGVFVRDLTHILSVVLQALFFLLPICYTLEMVPEWAQTLILFNPLAGMIEQIRSLVLLGQVPAWSQVAVLFGVSIVVAQLGHGIFAAVRRRFADVL